MKFALIPVLLVLALLAAGCTSAAPAAPAPAGTPVAPPAPAAIPVLTGTWAGPTEGYEAGIGYYNFTGTPITMVVTEQRGRIFSGHLLIRVNGTEETKEMTGVIGKDGRTLSLVEKGGGYTSGTISQDGIELIYVYDTPISVAIDLLKKQ